jgi:cell fate (sporulation/competence/biofilm development) regulator YlbF (YheA/YmcA/DUF963 family)
MDNQIKDNKNMYYRNEEVEVLTVNYSFDTALIKITIPKLVQEGDGYYEQDCWQPKYMYTEVPLKELTKQPINLFEQWNAMQKDLDNKYKTYQEQEKELKSKIKKLETEYDEKIKKYKEQDKTFDDLIKFMNNKIKFVVAYDYCLLYRIFPIEDFVKDDSNYGNNSNIRLISIIGNIKNNKLNFYINRYSDGSGADSKFIPFETQEEARKYVISEIEYKINGGERGCLQETIKRLNILPEESSIIAEASLKEKEKTVQGYKENIKKLNNEINEINKKIAEEEVK